MVQTQEETKEKNERNLPLEETKEEIYVPGEEINQEITEERNEESHSPMEDTKEEILRRMKSRKSFFYGRNKKNEFGKNNRSQKSK